VVRETNASSKEITNYVSLGLPIQGQVGEERFAHETKGQIYYFDIGYTENLNTGRNYFGTLLSYDKTLKQIKLLARDMSLPQNSIVDEFSNTNLLRGTGQLSVTENGEIYYSTLLEEVTLYSDVKSGRGILASTNLMVKNL
jgi:hypothetical protein